MIDVCGDTYMYTIVVTDTVKTIEIFGITRPPTI